MIIKIYIIFKFITLIFFDYSLDYLKISNKELKFLKSNRFIIFSVRSLFFFLLFSKELKNNINNKLNFRRKFTSHWVFVVANNIRLYPGKVENSDRLSIKVRAIPKAEIHW